ncbi:hypothetical protein [Hyphomonas sp. CACIAM 19H1]|uniref:hypothetical protein n=1 Tax=Hyphomonas sp. CACIAM 19H1 TaxID=1873716 RepID=UPI0013B04E65|nr:hypothetical protein [Hyphomonas sp. CACIAM 19H1]
MDDFNCDAYPSPAGSTVIERLHSGTKFWPRRTTQQTSFGAGKYLANALSLGQILCATTPKSPGDSSGAALLLEDCPSSRAGFGKQEIRRSNLLIADGNRLSVFLVSALWRANDSAVSARKPSYRTFRSVALALPAMMLSPRRSNDA